jgi:hypothetical protein
MSKQHKAIALAVGTLLLVGGEAEDQEPIGFLLAGSEEKHK